MINVAGLTVNFLAALVLLGTNVRFIEKNIEKLDPVHWAYQGALIRIQQISAGELDHGDQRAHPYDHVVESYWRLWPLLKFIDRHVEQDIPLDCTIDIRGGWFKIDGEQLMLSDNRRRVALPDDWSGEETSLDTGGKASLNAVFGLIYEARRKRIYFWGVTGLVIGFGLQLTHTVVF